MSDFWVVVGGNELGIYKVWYVELGTQVSLSYSFSHPALICPVENQHHHSL